MSMDAIAVGQIVADKITADRMLIYPHVVAIQSFLRDNCAHLRGAAGRSSLPNR
jgi:hypothetical protein